MSLPIQASALFRVEPQNPIEGQMVQLYYFGCEPVVPNIATNELYYLEQEGNQINFIGSFGYGLPTCPIVYEHYFDIGALPVGDYQLDIYYRLATTPFPINTGVSNPGLTLNFGVIKPVQVPTLHFYTLVMLALLFLILTREVNRNEI